MFTVSDAGNLIELAEVIRQIAIFGDEAQVAFEMVAIDRIEASERGEQPPIGFGEPDAGEIGRCRDSMSSIQSTPSTKTPCAMLLLLAGSA